MPFDFTCVHCGGEMIVSTRYGKIQCTVCGRFLDGTLPEDEPESDNATLETWRLGSVYYTGERTRWIEALLSRLDTHLRRGNREEALRACDDLIGMDRDMVDALYWQARLTDDDDLKQANLSRVLALAPQHAEARNMMLVLRGELTEAELDRANNLYRNNAQQASGAVATETQVLLCPVCRGTLTVNAAGGVECAFCGYADESDSHAVHLTPATSLAAALIKQRGQAVRWQVGERMLHCNGCGAERTLPANKMSDQCPFCGSTNVVLQDALGAFRQPDGLLKFQVRRSVVEQKVDAALNSRTERFKGIFINNAVERMTYSGVFLPFWVFDVFGTVTRREEKRDTEGFIVDTLNSDFAEQLRHAPIPAVKSPPPKLLAELGDYDFDEVIPYTPKLLSKFPAELYSIDFAQASMEVRSVFRKAMIQKYGKNGNRHDYTVQIQSMVDYVEMRLILLPVWVITIYEKDADVRLALVNGQSGKLVLGRANKPEA